MAYTEKLTREEAVSVATAFTSAFVTAEMQLHRGLSDTVRNKLAEDVLSLVSQLRVGILIIGKDEPNV